VFNAKWHAEDRLSATSAVLAQKECFVLKKLGLILALILGPPHLVAAQVQADYGCSGERYCAIGLASDCYERVAQRANAALAVTKRRAIARHPRQQRDIMAQTAALAAAVAANRVRIANDNPELNGQYAAVQEMIFEIRETRALTATLRRRYLR
jgi:hypothetical protein